MISRRPCCWFGNNNISNIRTRIANIIWFLHHGSKLKIDANKTGLLMSSSGYWSATISVLIFRDLCQWLNTQNSPNVGSIPSLSQHWAMISRLHLWQTTPSVRGEHPAFLMGYCPQGCVLHVAEPRGSLVSRCSVGWHCQWASSSLWYAGDMKQDF